MDEFINDDSKLAGSSGSVPDPIQTPPALHNAAQRFLNDVNFDALGLQTPDLQGKVNANPKTAAIVLAGGQGERFGRANGKQLVDLAGRPMLSWSAKAFDAVGDVGLIVIVCPKDRQEEYRKLAIEPYHFATPVVFADAGTIRQESAFSGLQAVPESYQFVMLHDGARPMITPELVSHVLNTLKGNLDADGAVMAHPSVDTLKVVEDGVIMGTPDRTVFWNAQTPQVFRSEIYRRAQASALSDGFVGTDDSSLVERLGGKVLVVEGKRDNIKLTVPEDYTMLATAIRTLIESQQSNAKTNDEKDA